MKNVCFHVFFLIVTIYMRIFRLTDNVIIQVVYLHCFKFYKCSLIIKKHKNSNCQFNNGSLYFFSCIVRYTIYCIHDIVYIFIYIIIYTRYSSFLALLNFSQIATQKSHSVNTVNPFPSYQTFIQVSTRSRVFIQYTVRNIIINRLSSILSVHNGLVGE